ESTQRQPIVLPENFACSRAAPAIKTLKNTHSFEVKWTHGPKRAVPEVLGERSGDHPKRDLTDSRGRRLPARSQIAHGARDRLVDRPGAHRPRGGLRERLLGVGRGPGARHD